MKSLFSYTMTSVFAAVCCLVPAPAAAEDVTVAIEVLVISVAPEGVFGIEVGDVLTGTYMFDTDTIDASIDPETGEDTRPEMGYYSHNVPPYGIKLTFGEGEDAVMFESAEGPAGWNSGFEAFTANSEPTEGSDMLFIY